MVRIVKDSAVRRSEILEAAQRLLYAKGYEQMTIQDILDELHISKGAFYHYFESKQTLLEALIRYMVEEAEKFIQPILEAPQLTALEKLERYFLTAGRWKTERKEMLLALVRVWYSDDMAIVRQKFLTSNIKLFSPLFAETIRQGIREGSFDTAHPDEMGAVLLYLMQGLGDAMTDLILAGGPVDDALRRLENLLLVYTDAIERVLGAAPGSLHLVDMEILGEWLVQPQPVEPAGINNENRKTLKVSENH